LERLDHLSATPFQLAEQISDTRHGNVRVQMFVLFPVFSVGGQFRRALEVDGEGVTADAGIKGLVLEIEFEAEFLAVVHNGPVEIVDKELWGYTGNVSTLSGRYGHLIHSQPVIGREPRIEFIISEVASGTG
jgi:hypothetical protein